MKKKNQVLFIIGKMLIYLLLRQIHFVEALYFRGKVGTDLTSRNNFDMYINDRMEKKLH